MKILEFLERADEGHFPLGADAWDISLMYSLERDTIVKKIREEAAAEWQRSKPNVAAAIEQGAKVINAIKGKYTRTDRHAPDHKIFGDAKSGELKRQSPSPTTITTMKVAFWIALLAEGTVMLVQQAVTGDFNPFIVVLAVLLGLGGFFQGWGLGNLFFKRWLDETRRKGESLGQYWLMIGVGTALILLISGIRGASGTSPMLFALVFLVTLFFGEAVAVCEALAVKFAAQRRRLLMEMAQSQHWEATERHGGDLGDYLKEYELAVKGYASGTMSPLTGKPVSDQPGPAVG